MSEQMKESTSELLKNISKLLDSGDTDYMKMVSTTRRLEMIDVDLLETDPDNSYSKENEDMGYDDLLETFPIVGLISPLAVKGPYDNGMYRVMAGNRRITAIHMMGDMFWKTPNADPNKRIPCYIIGDKDMNSDYASIIIEIDNLISRDQKFKYIHRQSVVKKLIKMAGSESNQIRKVSGIAAKIFKTSERYARQWVALETKGIEELGKMITDGKITLKQANRITVLDKEEQEIAVKRIKDLDTLSLSVKDASAQIDSIIQEYNKSQNTAMTGREHKTAESLYKDLDSTTTQETPSIRPAETSEIDEPDFSTMTVPDEFISDTDYNNLNSIDNIEQDDYEEDTVPYDDAVYGFGSDWEPDIIPQVLSGEITEKKKNTYKQDPYKQPEVIESVISGQNTMANMSAIKQSDTKESYEKIQRDKVAKQVISWCSEMLNCMAPTDLELSAIDSCKKIAQKY